MEQFKNAMLEMIQERYPLEVTPVPEDLCTIRYYLSAGLLGAVSSTVTP